MTVPSVLTQVLNDMQAVAKTNNVTLKPDIYKAVPAPDTSWVGLLLTGLLPLHRHRRFHLLHDATGPGDE